MSRSAKSFNQHAAGGRVHGVGVLREQEHDPYRPRGKWAEGTSCRRCSATVHRGVWRWPAATESHGAKHPPGEPQARTVLCAACARIERHEAVGVLWIDPRLMANQAEQIRAVLEHEGKAEAQDHPLERIMSVETDRDDGACLVQTTGLHVLRRLAHALEHACSASLATRYLEGEKRAVMRLHADPA